VAVDGGSTSVRGPPRDARLQATLDAIVRTASELSGFDGAVALVQSDQLVPQAATGRPPHLLDLVQQQIGTGPCIEAARRQEPVRVADTRTEPRCETFGTRAADLGIISMLCYPLCVNDRLLGTLSLYADRPAAFGVQDERIAIVCAALAAVALAEAHRAEQLHNALASRDTIGQAKGILMERFKLTSDQAFATLADVSQRRNRKLTTVARHLVETGELLGDAS
jgi:GAF domain-containing protein